MERPVHSPTQFQEVPRAAIEMALQKKWLTFELAEPHAADGVARDASLWALASTLDPGESLSLQYHLCPDKGFCLALGLQYAPGRGKKPGFMAREKSLLRAARVAFPGFARSTRPVGIMAHKAAIAAERVNIQALLEAPRKAYPGPRPLEVSGLSLPMLPLARLNVTAALAGLAALDVDCALTLTVAPMVLDAVALRALAKVEVCLNATPNLTVLQSRLRIDSLAAAIALWQGAPEGFTIRATFGVSCPADLGHGTLAARLLFGNGGVDSYGFSSLDLSQSLPSTAQLPCLTPSAEGMVASGLLSASSSATMLAKSASLRFWLSL